MTFRTFRLNNDTIDEPVETIRMVATNADGDVPSDPQYYRINDDVNDVPPSVTVGDLTVRAAAWWDPRPKLPTAHPALLPEGVRLLRAAVYGEGVPHSAFTLPGLPSGPSGPLAALRGAVRRADLDAALRTATRLVGLGPGLTPAGDDVLAGTTAGLVLLGHPAAERFGAGVTGLAAGRTTELSRALLRHAAAGRVSGEFAAVLRALVGDGALPPAIEALLRTGSTSGRALALGLCTAIDLVDRTTRPR